MIKEGVQIIFFLDRKAFEKQVGGNALLPSGVFWPCGAATKTLGKQDS